MSASFGPVEAWASDPFVPTIRDGYLYGRGAADMKGSVAAFVVALEDYARRHPKHEGTVAVLLSVASGIFPAWQAAKLPVVQALRRVE